MGGFGSWSATGHKSLSWASVQSKTGGRLSCAANAQMAQVPAGLGGVLFLESVEWVGEEDWQQQKGHAWLGCEFEPGNCTTPR